jgi:hypothetical protein
MVCARKSVKTAAYGGEKVRIAHGGVILRILPSGLITALKEGMQRDDHAPIAITISPFKQNSPRAVFQPGNQPGRAASLASVRGLKDRD